jgi:hypothetical protein
MDCIKPPNTKQKLRIFLARLSFIRQYIPHFHDIIRPLVNLSINDTFHWTNNHQFIFEYLNRALYCHYNNLLIHPRSHG